MWAREAEVGVTKGGFCETFQGSTALGKGVVLLTGTPDLEEKLRRDLPAVHRRVNEVVHLTYMSRGEIKTFFRRFLSPFVPEFAEWSTWQETFIEGPFGTGSFAATISIDLLRQFFMKVLTKLSAMDIGHKVGTQFTVFPEKYSQFFEAVCDATDANAFIDSFRRPF